MDQISQQLLMNVEFRKPDNVLIISILLSLWYPNI